MFHVDENLQSFKIRLGNITHPTKYWRNICVELSAPVGKGHLKTKKIAHMKNIVSCDPISSGFS